MSNDVEIRWQGLDGCIATLKGLPAVMRTKLLRPALTAAGRIPRDAAKSRTPVLRTSTYSGASAIRRGVRKPGTVRNAIRVRASKRDKAEGNVGVFVNVRPLTGTQIRRFKSASGRAGKDNPNDPYYWRWVNFGKVGKAGAFFLEYGASKLGAALQKFTSVLGPSVDKLNNTRGK